MAPGAKYVFRVFLRFDYLLREKERKPTSWGRGRGRGKQGGYLLSGELGTRLQLRTLQS